MVVDPVTAVSIASSSLKFAKTAWELGNVLYKFVKDTRNVNETVKALAGEITALGNLCNLVHEELAGVVGGGQVDRPDQLYDKDGHMWESVQDELEGCDRTISKLQVIVSKVEEEGNMFRQVNRQVRLNWNKDDMEEIRRDVHFHCQNLQISLQIINIKVAHLAPRYANYELAVKIDTLQNTIQRMESRMETDVQKPATVRSTTTIIECAKEVLSSSSTLYDFSVADGSIQGGRSAANINLRVAEWAGAVESLRRDTEAPEPSELGSYTPSVFSGDGARTATTIVTSTDGGIGLGEFVKEVDEADYSDNDLAIDLAQSAWTEGGLAFEDGQWEDAESLLKEALTELRQLPAKHRTFCDVGELEYKLAVCAYHTRDVGVAKEALINFVEQGPTSDAHRLRICDAGQLLSHIYIRSGSSESLELAKAQCQNVLRARARLLGKDDSQYHESVALMVRIYQLLGNNPRAKVYMGMIPRDRREAIMAAAGISEPPTPATSPTMELASSIGAISPPPPTPPQREPPSVPMIRQEDAAMPSAMPAPTRSAESERLPTYTRGVSAPEAVTSFKQTDKEHGTHSIQPVNRNRTIQLSPILDPSHSQPQLNFKPISKTVVGNVGVIRLGWYEEGGNSSQDPDNVRIGLRSSLLNFRHCKFWCAEGQWYVRDTKSRLGTFVNYVRLSPPNELSEPHPINDGDTVQLAWNHDEPEGSDSLVVMMRIHCKVSELGEGLSRTQSVDEYLAIPAEPPKRSLSSSRIVQQTSQSDRPGPPTVSSICWGPHPRAPASAAARKEILEKLDFMPQSSLRWKELSVTDRPRKSFNRLRLSHQIVDALVEHGFELNKSMKFRKLDDYDKLCPNKSPLHLAIGVRHRPTVHLLLKRGANLRARYFNRFAGAAGELLRPAWLNLVECKDAQQITDIISLLLDAGWDVNEDVWKDTDRPLRLIDEALEIPDPQNTLRRPVIKFLLQHGAQLVYTKDSDQRRTIPLHRAVIHGTSGLISLLLRTQTAEQLQAKDRLHDGIVQDALCLAVRQVLLRPTTSSSEKIRTRENIRALLAAGADVHAVNEVAEKLLPDSLQNKSRMKKLFHVEQAGEVMVNVTPLQLAHATDRQDLIDLMQQFVSPASGNVPRPPLPGASEPENAFDHPLPSSTSQEQPHRAPPPVPGSTDGTPDSTTLGRSRSVPERPAEAQLHASPAWPDAEVLSADHERSQAIQGLDLINGDLASGDDRALTNRPDEPARIRPQATVHAGVYCDGPHCREKLGKSSYITGLRYKCAECENLDFCISCVYSSDNQHSRTHSIIVLGMHIAEHPDLTESDVDLSSPANKKLRRALCDQYKLNQRTELGKAMCEGLTDVAFTMAQSSMLQPTEESLELLPLAALFGDLDIAEVLLAGGFDVNGTMQLSANRYGAGRPCEFTALHLAILALRKPLVKLLLARGADINPVAADAGGGPVAKYSGSAVGMLFSQTQVMLRRAATQDHIDILSWLLDAGWPIDRKVMQMKGQQLDRRMLLHLACWSDVPTPSPGELIRFLLDRGASVWIPDFNNKIPLHNAIYSAQPNVVRLLLTSEAKPQLERKIPSNPSLSEDALCHAVRLYLTGVQAPEIHDGYFECARELLLAGADKNSQNRIPPNLMPKASSLWARSSKYLSIGRERQITPMRLALASGQRKLIRMLEYDGNEPPDIQEEDGS